MTETMKITAQARDGFGKGASRQLRRDGMIPAVVYGQGEETLHIAVAERDVAKALRARNTLMTVTTDGDERLVIAKDVQRNFIQQTVEHVDLLEVKEGDLVTVKVNVRVVGHAEPGTISNLQQPWIKINVDATAIPDHLDADISGRGPTRHVTAGDIELPEGATLVSQPKQLVVNVSAVRAKAAPGATEED